MEGIRQYSEGTYLLHKTWSYAKTFSHERYGSNPMDQEAMDRDIDKAYEEASDISGIRYIIPSGTCIRLARQKYGDNLARDGYHQNEMARTLTGILWVMFLTGNTNLDLTNFKPSGYTYDDVTGPVDEKTIQELVEIVKEGLKENKGHNLYE